MPKWTFRPSSGGEDHFIIEGPALGSNLYRHFGACFPGNSRAIVFPLEGTPTELDWRELKEIELQPGDRLELPGNPTSIGPLEHVMARLLDEDGCPWDREQTPLSLVRYLLDESYEAGEALVAGDEAGLADELGDVLLQVVFHSAIAERFSMTDVVASQVDKLIRRHPHVFSGEHWTASAVNEQWERLKALDPPREQSAEWVYPSLAWARRLSKRGIVPSSDVFEAVSEFLKVYIGNNEGKLEETLADAAWAVADVSRQHHQDVEWSLWKRLAFFNRGNTFS
ncbi:MAG: nucleotide pyrophosphohydrolase [Firmicutes bacterium]|nr:nucleotide pyrophosphohydrolase [Bacillota bacterium]